MSATTGKNTTSMTIGRASSTSSSEQQVFVRLTPMSSLWKSFIVAPMHSQPCSFIKNAATLESTPPLIAMSTLSIFPHIMRHALAQGMSL